MFGCGHEVMHFVAIGLEVVKFLGRLGIPERVLRRVELARIVEGLPDPCGGRLEHVSDVLAVNLVRHIVANVDEASVACASDQVDPLVHPAPETENERLRRSLKRPRKACPCIQSGGLMAARLRTVGAKSTKLTRRSDFAPGVIVGRSKVLELLRNVDDQRHLQSRVTRPALAARHARSVVGEVEDDRVVGEAGSRQLFQVFARVGIGRGHPIIVLGPVPASLGSVGMVRRDPDPGRIMNRPVRANANLALVAPRRVKHREKRLTPPAILPVCPRRRFVPHLPGSKRL